MTILSVLRYDVNSVFGDVVSVNDVDDGRMVMNWNNSFVFDKIEAATVAPSSIYRYKAGYLIKRNVNVSISEPSLGGLVRRDFDLLVANGFKIDNKFSMIEWMQSLTDDGLTLLNWYHKMIQGHLVTAATQSCSSVGHKFDFFYDKSYFSGLIAANTGRGNKLTPQLIQRWCEAHNRVNSRYTRHQSSCVPAVSEAVSAPIDFY